MNDPRLTAYALGELSGREREKFERDLAASEDLQRELTATIDLTDALEQALARPGPASLAELNRALLSSVPDRPHYELGRWVEASRVAAATSNQAFFGSPTFPAVMEHARGMALPDEVRAELARAAAGAESEHPDFRKLERAFEQVCLLY